MRIRSIELESQRVLLKAITLVMAFLFAATPSLSKQPNAITEIEPSAAVYLSLSDKHGFPLTEKQSHFDCLDKIYSVVELTNYQKGSYHLAIHWVDPTGDIRERTQYEFLVREQETRLWGWLSLSRAKGAGMLTWINPAAGLEEFVGEWRVEIRIDNKKIGLVVEL